MGKALVTWLYTRQIRLRRSKPSLLHTIMEDQLLWDTSTTTPSLSPSFSVWSFRGYEIFLDNHTITVPKKDAQDLTFALALFDLHFQYWHSKYITDSEISAAQVFNYHFSLRRMVEEHFKKRQDTTPLSGPPNLTIWLWRTLCLCGHGMRGRQDFEMICKKHSFLDQRVLMNPPSSEGWSLVPGKSY